MCETTLWLCVLLSARARLTVTLQDDGQLVYLEDWRDPPHVDGPRSEVLAHRDKEQEERDAEAEGEQEELHHEHG